ncbi:MAG: hypothetical protein R3C20_20565 [Planctomycetaceae bacterium]
MTVQIDDGVSTADGQIALRIDSSIHRWPERFDLPSPRSPQKFGAHFSNTGRLNGESCDSNNTQS